MENNEKIISDMYLVAVMFALGVSYSDILNENGRKKFVFSGNVSEAVIKNGDVFKVVRDVSLDEIESQYAGNNLFIPANAYSSAIRNVKSIIHAREDAKTR